MNTQDVEKIKSFAQEHYSKSKGQHDIHHVERVANNALLITDILGKKDEIDRNLLEAICYLHDILMIKKKRNFFLSLYNHIFERSINRKHLHTTIEKFGLPENESKILIRAIINHPYSIPFCILNKNNDIYSKILQDADSIDYISDQRLKSFNKTRRFLSPVSSLYIYLIKESIKYFLNFPELAKKLNLFRE